MRAARGAGWFARAGEWWARAEAAVEAELLQATTRSWCVQRIAQLLALVSVSPRGWRAYARPSPALTRMHRQSSFLQGLLGPLCTIDLEFSPNTGRAPVTVKGETGKPETLPLYTANDTVRGQARARAPRAHLRPGRPRRLDARRALQRRCGSTLVARLRLAYAQVHLSPAQGKKIDHQGIKVELLGTIELFFDRGNTYDFVSMCTCALARRRWRVLHSSSHSCSL